MADISKEQAVQLAREAAANTGNTLKDVPEAETVAFIVELIKLARNKALEEAKQACLMYSEPVFGGNVCAGAIESLKDNTP